MDEYELVAFAYYLGMKCGNHQFVDDDIIRWIASNIDDLLGQRDRLLICMYISAYLQRWYAGRTANAHDVASGIKVGRCALRAGRKLRWDRFRRGVLGLGLLPTERRRGRLCRQSLMRCWLQRL